MSISKVFCVVVATLYLPGKKSVMELELRVGLVLLVVMVVVPLTYGEVVGAVVMPHGEAKVMLWLLYCISAIAAIPK